jgi:hypothetical protein
LFCVAFSVTLQFVELGRPIAWNVSALFPAVTLGTVTGFASRDTAPVDASARPLSVAPVSRVMAEYARMVPENTEVTPRVAELTAQNTFFACAPFVRMTWLLVLVVNVLATWMTKTEDMLPAPSKVRSPVIPSVEVDL